MVYHEGPVFGVFVYLIGGVADHGTDADEIIVVSENGGGWG